MARKSDIAGERFGLLTAIRAAAYRRNNKTVWFCRCDCGGEKYVKRDQLKVGSVKSCGCLWRQPRLSSEEAVARQVTRGYKRNAVTRGLRFDLSIAQVKAFIFADCFYCGLPPKAVIPTTVVMSTAHRGILFNGIDRKDNSLGYIYNNCAPCCSLCNYMKRSLSVETFLHHVGRIKTFACENEDS